MQEVLGHKDISTTMNIYADVTKELETTEFENLDRHFTAWMKDADENGDVEQVSWNNLYEQRKKYIFLHTPFYADWYARRNKGHANWRKGIVWARNKSALKV